MQSKKTRIFRVILGVVLLGVAAYFSSWWIAVIAIVPLIVGITGFCPACYFLNRCSLKR